MLDKEQRVTLVEGGSIIVSIIIPYWETQTNDRILLFVLSVPLHSRLGEIVDFLAGPSEGPRVGKVQLVDDLDCKLVGKREEVVHVGDL